MEKNICKKYGTNVRNTVQKEINVKMLQKCIMYVVAVIMLKGQVIAVYGVGGRISHQFISSMQEDKDSHVTHSPPPQTLKLAAIVSSQP